MEVYKTKVSNNTLVEYSTFTYQVADFLKETIGKTNPAYYITKGFGFILNKGRRVTVVYDRVYTNSYKLVIKLSLLKNDENNYTTLVIPLKSTLTEELKEEIEYFIKEYLTENDK